MTGRAMVLAAMMVVGGTHTAAAQAPVEDRFLEVRTSAPLEYPQIARSARVEGPVVVAVTFDERGVVTDASALSGWPILREAAVANARKWTFAPNEQRRALLVYDFQIVSTCVDEAPPPPFKARRTLATVSACSLTVQPQTGED